MTRKSIPAVGLLRRSFLKGVVGGAGLGLTCPLLFSSSRAAAGPAGAASPALLLVVARGGLDALSAFVPYRDRDYYRARPTIAVPAPGARGEHAIDLDGTTALHPALESLLPLYRAGTMGAVIGVGHAARCVSHLQAEERLLKAALDAVGGAEHCEFARDVAPFDASAAQRRALLSEELSALARALCARPELSLGVAALDGFDTHFAEGAARGRLADRLVDLAEALCAAQRVLAQAGGRSVTTVVVSEFGRGVRENRTAGTDDGWAGAAFVFGDRARGGRVSGELRRTDDGRALAVTTPVDAFLRGLCTEQGAA